MTADILTYFLFVKVDLFHSSDGVTVRKYEILKKCSNCIKLNVNVWIVNIFPYEKVDYLGSSIKIINYLFNDSTAIFGIENVMIGNWIYAVLTSR